MPSGHIVRIVNGLKYGSNGGAPLANNTDSVDLATLGGAKTIEIYVADGAKDVLWEPGANR